MFGLCVAVQLSAAGCRQSAASLDSVKKKSFKKNPLPYMAVRGVASAVHHGR